MTEGEEGVVVDAVETEKGLVDMVEYLRTSAGQRS